MQSSDNCRSWLIFWLGALSGEQRAMSKYSQRTPFDAAGSQLVAHGS